MTDGGHSGSVPAVEQGGRWPTAVASLIVGLAFFSLWFWLLPQWLGFRAEMAGAAPWRWLAALPTVLGFAVALRCVWDFGWTGRGTPAPVAPPQLLVVLGFYRYVRNPTYLGFATGWIGLWVVFGHANPVAIVARPGQQNDLQRQASGSGLSLHHLAPGAVHGDTVKGTVERRK